MKGRTIGDGEREGETKEGEKCGGRGEKKKKKEGRVIFTMQSKALFKMICLGPGAASTRRSPPGVQLPSALVRQTRGEFSIHQGSNNPTAEV